MGEGIGMRFAVKGLVHQKRLVSVVCEGLWHSWTSKLPCTEVSTEVTVGMVGFVKSVRVVGVLEGLMDALDISEAGPDGVPACSVEPSDALSTPVLSCRKRFLLNLARAFWNQTCRDKEKKNPVSEGVVIYLSEIILHGILKLRDSWWCETSHFWNNSTL